MSDPVEQFLNRLQHPVLAGIDLSLDRMHRLLGVLGFPQRRLPPVIHVAGTNGKGSLIATLQAILEAAGYKVHRYTSPHLVQFNERILLQGKPISQQKLMSVLQHIAPILQQYPATFFEATTAAAFLAFAESKADVLLMETGLGGRLDATNVIEKPWLTAITPIAFDHMEYLGETIQKIAAEKAGIIKKNIPCVVGRQEPVALVVLEQTAQALGASLYRLGHEWKIEDGHYRSPKRELAFKPVLHGQYQFDNTATAIACIDQLPGFAITDEHILQGIANVSWPGRLQRLNLPAYTKWLPAHIPLWLDGGHNAQGGQVLADWLGAQPFEEIYLIGGMVRGKDSRGYFEPLSKVVKAIYTIAIPDESHSQSAESLAQAATQAGLETHSAESIEKALQTIASRANHSAMVCICGSLYLAGYILKKEAEHA